MKKGLIACIIAVVMLVFGILICGISFVLFGGDFSAMDTNKYVTNSYEITEDIENITISVVGADVKFELSSEDHVIGEIMDLPEKDYEVTAEGRELIVRNDDRASYFSFGIHTKYPRVTVYLPMTTLNTLQLEAATGDVWVPAGLSFSDVHITVVTGDVKFLGTVQNEMDIKLTTGDVAMEDCEMKALTIKAITGDVWLQDVIASDKIDIRLTTGDTDFIDVDAGEISVQTGTGDITGILLSGKTFSTHVVTGDVHLPESTAGGTCTLSTTTGDINISIK